VSLVPSPRPSAERSIEDPASSAVGSRKRGPVVSPLALAQIVFCYFARLRDPDHTFLSMMWLIVREAGCPAAHSATAGR